MKLLLALGLSMVSWCAHAVMNGRGADPSLSAATIAIRPTGAVRECTAVIVDPHLLFTAGHCTQGLYSQVFLLKAANDLKGRSQKSLHVMQWKTAPGYTEASTKEPEDVESDFAFMRVREDLYQVFNLQSFQVPRVPATLQEIKDLLAQSKDLTAYGYGKYTKSRGGQKRELRQLGTYVSEYNVLKTVSQETGAGVCEGDSGGGIFVRVNGNTVLLGNVSGIVAKKGCGTVESYALYSLAYSHLCWVKKASGIQIGNPNCSN